MAINEQSNNEGDIKQALNEWYLSDKKDYENFAAKYSMNGELAKQGYKIGAMENGAKKWIFNLHQPFL